MLDVPGTFSLSAWLLAWHVKKPIVSRLFGFPRPLHRVRNPLTPYLATFLLPQRQRPSAAHLHCFSFLFRQLRTEVIFGMKARFLPYFPLVDAVPDSWCRVPSSLFPDLTGAPADFFLSLKTLCVPPQCILPACNGHRASFPPQTSPNRFSFLIFFL